MDNLKELMEFLNVSEEDAIKAILTSTSPPSPPTTRQNWSRLTTFGNSSPYSEDLWQKLVESDFKCNKCSSQIRLSFNYIDGNSKNHLLSNLEVICFDCNRRISKKGTVDINHNLKIVLTAIKLWKEAGIFPKFSRIKKEANVKQIGGATYLLKFLERRLNKYKEEHEFIFIKKD